MDFAADSPRPLADGPVRAIWFCLLVVAGAGSSFAFACAAPFAAVAALAALKTEWRQGLAAVGLVWLANQAIGYGALGYPWTLNSLAWGLALGAASVLAMGAAAAFAATRPVRFALSLPFVAAFAVYELVLYVAAAGLGAAPNAFSLATVKQVFVINAGAFLVLLAVHATILAVARFNRSGADTMMPASR